jgi:hypothetical protein
VLSDALKAFLPCVIQTLPALASELEEFRTEVLGKYLPAEKKDAAEVNSYMDSLIGLDSLQVPDVPIVNSRAGLYIYLSAAVSFCSNGFAASMLTGHSSWGDPCWTMPRFLHTYTTDTRETSSWQQSS